jgi:hypothetical protein
VSHFRGGGRHRRHHRRPLVCVGCGCTEARACLGGCSWRHEEPPICTACYEEFETVFLDGPTPPEGIELPESRATRVADAMLARAVAAGVLG